MATNEKLKPFDHSTAFELAKLGLHIQALCRYGTWGDSILVTHPPKLEDTLQTYFDGKWSLHNSHNKYRIKAKGLVYEKD